MRFLMALAVAAALLTGGAPARAQDGSQAFTVGGLDVDFYGKSTDEARFAAYRDAQRRAWKQLYARLTGNPPTSAPNLPDSALDAMVAGIEVEAERFSTRRYIARLGVVFDRVRAGRYLGSNATALTSPPMLLLPVLDDGGARTVYERRSPWLRAWARYRAGATPIQYVRADGTSADTILLNAYQSRRDNRRLWSTILNRYRTADVLTAEAKLDRVYPGGPVVGTFTARHGADATPIARFKLRSNAGGLEQMLDEAVRRLDFAYGQAFRAGLLRADPTLLAEFEPLRSGGATIAVAAVSGTEVEVPTPDASTWASTESLIRGTPGVRGLSIVSLSLGGLSRIRINDAEGFDWLQYNLDQRGLRLEPGGTGYRIRRRQPGDVPIPRPLTAEEMEAAAEAAAAAAGGEQTPPPAAPAPNQLPPQRPTATPAPRPAQPDEEMAPPSSPTP